MININNKSWDKLRFSDVEKLLSGNEEENFFFEFKNDAVEPPKLVKEISAFANTYGGYVLLGVDDDKTISGCTEWNEQRIHSTIYDSITPIPNFDVKRFKTNGKVIFIIKIEEGTIPPYITNKGQIFERVSSGSFSIKQSSKLEQLYQKRQDQLIRIKNKIELPSINVDGTFPNGIFGYIDIGFNVVWSQPTALQKNFYRFDMQPIAEYMRSITPHFSISRIGHSYFFSIGEAIWKDDNERTYPLGAGIHNFMEIIYDGSVRSRVILTGTNQESLVDITPIIHVMDVVFKNIYSKIIGEKFVKNFIHAHRYEKLTVLKQFVPFYKLRLEDNEINEQPFLQYWSNHKEKYGNNLIIESNRCPKNDYSIIDKSTFDNKKINVFV